MIKDLVSIGMPVYKGIPIVKRAIESALNQTYQNIELVITDNPADEDDGTQALCEEYARKDKRVKYIRHKENIGAEANYRAAFNEARGEYFCWVAFDDFLDKNFAEKCVAMLKSDKGVVLAMGDFAMVNVAGEVTHKLDPKGFVIRERDLYARLKTFILMRWWDGKVMAIHGLWRRAAIANNIYRDLPDGDINFVFRGLSRGPFLFTKEILFYKGVLPGRESREHEKLTLRRLFSAIWTRIKLIQPHGKNMRFILKIPDLSLLSRSKLVFWECVAVARMFLHRKF